MKTIPCLALLLLAPPSLQAADDVPQMKFNDVKEVAPGVFFRYSSIHATDKTVPFGGSNHIWIVMEDYVIVIDANFPKEAADVIKDIRKTTDKPIRYVLDTHHHGDHAYGNAVWVKEGATIVGQRNCFRLMTTKGPEEFAQAGRGPMGRKDVAESTLRAPSLVFDDRLVFDDGRQRVEFFYVGHMHTTGDAFAYLPKHKLLCTGDACVNGAFNFMGHSDTASWIKCLERLEQLDVRMILPGHGPPAAAKDLLGKQKRYFVELRKQVQVGIDAKQSLEDITKAMDMPWYKEWTGKDAKDNGDNVKHVYEELTGKLKPYDTVAQLGTLEGDSYCKATPGWTKPKRIVIPNLPPGRLAELKHAAPEIEFIRARTTEEAVKLVADADAVLGFCGPELLHSGAKLRWVQIGAEPVANDLVASLGKAKISLTTTEPVARSTSPDVEWQLWRENVRRFAAGERLLAVAALR
jgi:glyoxylase-like metal-dependent hydrolase (beta-lactamase superfamily II)